VLLIRPRCCARAIPCAAGRGERMAAVRTEDVEAGRWVGRFDRSQTLDMRTQFVWRKTWTTGVFYQPEEAGSNRPRLVTLRKIRGPYLHMINLRRSSNKARPGPQPSDLEA
jgi:hypothetical protein